MCTKYDYEFKMKVVKDYLSGVAGYGTLAKLYNIPNKDQIHRWVKRYLSLGENSLKPKGYVTKYSMNFKLDVVKSYLQEDASYLTIANKFGIDHTAVMAWVEKYADSDALSRKNKERTAPKHVSKKERKKFRTPAHRSIRTRSAVVNDRKSLFKRIEEAARGKKLSTEEKARIAYSFRKEYKLKDILAVIHMSKSTYSYWQKRFDRENPDAVIEKELLDLRSKHENLGYRGLQAKLKERGFIVNHKKVYRLVKKLGLEVTAYTKRGRKYNSYKGKVGKVAPNRLNRRFSTSIPHQKITTDTSEFKYYEVNEAGNEIVKKLYLDPFLDMYNGEVISHRTSKHPTAENIMSGLRETLEKTADCKYRRTFHSDQGWCYQMKKYVKELRDAKVYQSMSRKGTCLDNSIMENFFGIMKQEIYYGRKYKSYEELENAINRYIIYYNTERPKKRLGWLSPIEYRMRAI